jgi:flagellar biosynthesis chaperone FliJ
MSDEKGGFGSGILKGLKKMLFTDEPTAETPTDKPQAPQPVPAPTVAPVPPTPVAHNAPTAAAPSDVKDMKLKVYQLLESMNQPGCDFFEVWNAATEMGGANAVNIKAAFTSLRFADSTLSKDKLLQTGAFYKTSLTNVLDTETRKRDEEKQQLQRQEDQAKTNLDNSIQQLEQQIASLQQQLAAQKTERDNIHSKYQPAITELDAKIAAGQQSVSSVIAEMEQVLQIIQKELN